MSSDRAKAAKRAEASGAPSDLETAAKAVLVTGSATSEKSAAERLEDAKDKVTADKAKGSAEDLEAAAKAKSDTARYEALAKAHGADLSEEGVDETLTKMAPRRG